MATETAKIVIEGDTNGATVALKETARATDGVTTASKAAGAQLADLTRQTAATSKAQADATAAINRMRQAQDEAAMTARAFGTESREAAEATDRLKRATDAAKAAEAAAKQELEQLKLGLAATSAAADKASPALARATKETEKLSAAAERNANELKKSELAQAANARASGKGAEGFGLLGAAGGKLAAVLGPAALAGTLMATGRWLGENAEKTLQFETALANLPFGLEGAKAATRGLIDEQTLLAAASSATSLKVTKTSAEFETLAAASVKLGAKLGQPADQLLNNLVTALGRNSTELLDNAGIVLKTGEAQERYAASIGKTVDQLTDEQKAAAFRVEAFKAIVAAADQTTVAAESNAAALVRLKVQAGDTWGSIERAAVNAAGAVVVAAQGAAGTLEDYAKNADEAAKITARWNDEADAGPITMTDWALATVRTSEAYAGLQTILASDTWKNAVSDGKARAAAMDQEAQFAERQARAYAKLAAEQEAHLDAQAMASITYGPAPAPKSEKKKGGKAKREDFIDSSSMQTYRTNADMDGGSATDAIASDAAYIERSNAALAEAAAIQQNVDARQASIDAIGEEIDAREAAGLAADDLIAQRMSAERALYDYERRNAKDRAALLEVETKHAKTQQTNRLAALKSTYAAEKKEQEKRAAHIQSVQGHVEGFSTALVTGMQEEADGAEHAIAKSLQAWFKGISAQMAVKAVVEFALAAASAASMNPVGAAAHATAGGLAAAAAIAAGGAAAAVGAAIPADKPDTKVPATGASSGGSSRSGSDRDGNERQDVPMSWAEQRSKSAVDMPRPNGATSTQTTHVTHVHVTGLVAGDENELGAKLNRLMAKGQRQGKRY